MLFNITDHFYCLDSENTSGALLWHAHTRYSTNPVVYWLSQGKTATLSPPYGWTDGFCSQISVSLVRKSLDVTLREYIWFAWFHVWACCLPPATCDLLFHYFRRAARKWKLWFNIRCVNRGERSAAASDVCERVMTLQSPECNWSIFCKTSFIQGKLWSEVTLEMTETQDLGHTGN